MSRGLEVRWDDLRVGTRAALRTPDPRNIGLGGRSVEELVAITSGEIVVVDAPADAKLPRSVAGHVQTAIVPPPTPKPRTDDDDEEARGACPSCGAENDGDATECDKCGAVMPGPDPDARVTAATKSSLSREPETSPNDPEMIAGLAQLAARFAPPDRMRGAPTFSMPSEQSYEPLVLSRETPRDRMAKRSGLSGGAASHLPDAVLASMALRGGR